MVEPTSLLLGLEGLEVRAVAVAADRARVVDVVTVDPGAAKCPECRVASRSVKGHAVTRPRDIPYGDDPIQLRWNKTRYYCRNQACGRRSFTESVPEVPPRRRTTTRLRTQIGRSIGEAARSVVEVAAGAGVSWPTAHTAFVEHAKRVLKDPAPVR
ncbi:transposase family protein, partial [Gordonia sp. ABSL49_1]